MPKFIDAEGRRPRVSAFQESNAITPPGRLQFIDATRGAAMFLVFVAHFADMFFVRPDALTPVLMRSVGLVSSPTFAIVNGLLIGFLYRTRPASFDAFRIKLLDRGLFLLTIGHCVMVGAHFALVPTTHWLLITDAIGFSVIVGPWLVTRVRPVHRLLIGLSGYAISWIVIALWQPAPGWAAFISETLFGNLHGTFYAYAFPLLPWFSLDFASTVIGERLAIHYLGGDRRAMLRFIARLGATALALAAAAEAIVLSATTTPLHKGDFLFALGYLHQKSPPGPVYLLFHAGLGLMLLSTLLLIETKGRAHRLMSYAAALGQTSLFAFIVQYYVYFTGLHVLRHYLPYPSAWPVYFSVTVLLVIVPVREWHRRDLNRFITVGCQYVWRWRAMLGLADASSDGWDARNMPSVVEQ